MKYLPALLLCLLFPGVSYAATLKGKALVVDGDTIKLAGESVRIYGIDTPEAGQKCNRRGGGKWNCGKIATAAITKLIRGRTVICTFSARDENGRPLGTCKVGPTVINEWMVRFGYAWAFVRYSKIYIDIEAEAKAEKRGIWQAPTQTPWEYRAQRWKVAKQKAPKGCPIKGNINRQKEKIYHAPWSPWYKRTKVSVNKGERWFCSENEAIKAGWRAPDWG